jgi:hypothetical protein
MATSFGTTTGLFGIASQQTGFLLDSTSDEYSQDNAAVKNITGDDTGETYFNERIEGTLEGWFPASSGYSGTLAASITLANTPADHLIGSVTGGTTIVQGITRGATSQDYRRITLRYKYSPTILAA